MRTQMENVMAIYPEDPVGEGDSWVKDVALNMGMPLQLTNTYNLAARDAGTAQIDITSVVEPGEGDPLVMGGMTIAYEVSGFQEGSTWVDEATGLVQRSTMTQQLGGEVTMNESMTWPIEIETRTTMEPLEE